MPLECSLCPKSAVYVPIIQLMFQQYSQCCKSTVYVPIVHSMSLEYYVCPYRTVYVHRVVFIFLLGHKLYYGDITVL